MPSTPAVSNPIDTGCHSHRAGVGMALAAAGSNQVGAGLGALAFPSVGPVGVVAVRQLITAFALAPAVRPRWSSLTARQQRMVIGLAVVFSVMNLSLYNAIECIGLGTAVTLEFLGPLAVALGSSRRLRDGGIAVVAGVGVITLTPPTPTSDLAGIGLGLLAACCWAAYILLNRSLGRSTTGLQATAMASVISAFAWLPIAAWWFSQNPPTATGLALAIACGVLASLVPYALDPLALRRIPTHVFSTLTSVNPVFAALAGLVVLGQSVEVHEWVGIGLIVLSSVVASSTRRRSPGVRSEDDMLAA